VTSISFPIPRKENERRRALLPAEVARMRNPRCLYFEKGYGEVLGIKDREYQAAGAHVAEYRKLFDYEVVCCIKSPGPEERGYYSSGSQVVFGWMHAVQGRSIADWLIERELTAIAWEDMYHQGKHVFWANNEIAGYAAVLHASLVWGKSVFGLKAALIGRGNTARGANRALAQLGADVSVYDRRNSPRLPAEIERYQVVVNAVLWDVFRPDHLVSRSDLARMCPGSVIIDISCDDGLGIETSHSTTIADPIYEEEGIFHYAVDHVPALLFKDASASISAAIAAYVDELADGDWSDCLKDALIVDHGKIVDERIARFQQR
jgi:N5-(carboxyethyl)ornithine synthase